MKTMNVKQKKRLEDNNTKYTLLSIMSVTVFLILWQIVVDYQLVPTKVLANPLQIARVFIDKLTSVKPDGATITTNALVSLKVSLTGFFAAVFIGTPLGFFMGWYKPVDRFVRPIFEIIRPIPPIAWIPLTILWVGIGLGAKAMIIFFSAFVPCVINSYTGITQTSEILIRVTKTYGASNFEIFRLVGIPSALPMAFAGIRIALGNSWGTLVAAELLAANAGLGYMISMGRQYSRPDIILLGMVVIGVLGFIFTWIFSKLEELVIPWRA